MCISDMRCWQKLRLPQFQSLKQLYGADRISRSPAFSFNLTNSTSFSFQRKVKIETRSCRRNDKNAFRKNLTNDQIEWRPKAQRSVICLEPKMENEKGTCVYVWVLAKNAAKLKTTIFHKLTKIVINWMSVHSVWNETVARLANQVLQDQGILNTGKKLLFPVSNWPLSHFLTRWFRFTALLQSFPLTDLLQQSQI